MLKNIVLLVLVASAITLTDKEILQQGLNGLFQSNKLPDPTTIVPCFDDKSAHDTVVFVGQVLDKAAKGSISDLLSLKDLIQQFGDSLPQAVKDCLSGNQQFTNLGYKYGINETTDSAALQKKIIAYVTLHYLTVHKWLGDLNNLWKAGKYYQVGYDGATYGHSILGAQLNLPQLTDKQIIQQGLNGLFEQNKLKDPTTIVPCFDDKSAHDTVVFVGQLLDKAAKGSISDLLSLKDLIQKFGDSLPQAVKDCLNGNQQFTDLGKKYGIDQNTDSSALQKKIIAYVTLHYLTVHKWLGDLNNLWKAGKYYQVGFDGAGYGHNVLGINESKYVQAKKLLREMIHSN